MNDDTERREHSEPSPATKSDNSSLLVILGFVSAILVPVFFPVFAAVSVVLGVILCRRENKMGRWVIAAGVVVTILFILVAIMMLG